LRTRPVRDQDQRLVAVLGLEVVEDLELGVGVDRAGRLVMIKVGADTSVSHFTIRASYVLCHRGRRARTRLGTAM